MIYGCLIYSAHTSFNAFPVPEKKSAIESNKFSRDDMSQVWAKRLKKDWIVSVCTLVHGTVTIIIRQH